MRNKVEKPEVIQKLQDLLQSTYEVLNKEQKPKFVNLLDEITELMIQYKDGVISLEEYFQKLDLVNKHQETK